MAVIWMGGEDTAFPNGIAPSISLSATFNASFSRCSLSTAWPNVTVPLKSTIFKGGAVDSCWFHFELYHNDQGAHKGLRFAGLGKLGTTCGLWVGNSLANVNALMLSKFDGTTSTTLDAESVGVLLPDGLFHVDVHVTSFSDTTSGNCKVYLNSALNPVIDFTGDMTLSGFTEIDTVLIQGTDDYNQARISECAVDENDTRTYRLCTIYNSTLGDVNSFDGDGYTGVDEIVINDNDLIYTNTAGETFSAGLSNLPTGVFRVVCVKRESRALASIDSSINGIDLGIKSGSTISLDSSAAMTTSYSTYEYYMEVNPVTSASFTQAEVDALQSVIVSSA